MHLENLRLTTFAELAGSARRTAISVKPPRASPKPVMVAAADQPEKQLNEFERPRRVGQPLAPTEEDKKDPRFLLKNGFENIPHLLICR